MRLSLLALLVCALAVAGGAWAQEDEVDDEYADSTAAFLLVSKAVANPDVTAYPVAVVGRNVTVEVTILNSGTGTASDVRYTDELPEDAELVEGSSLTASFRKLSVGSSVTHTYQMRFTKSRGSKILFLPHGKVTYTPDIGAKPQVGRSSSAGVFVFSPLQQLKAWALTAGRYCTLSFVRTEQDWVKIGYFMLAVGGLFGLNGLIKQVSSARVSSRRRRALKQLE